MRASIQLESRSLAEFKGKISTTISKVGSGSKKATEKACQDILDLSLDQVPRDTGTLASAASYRIQGDWRNGFYGETGYCLDRDPINPATGRPASYYVLAVHENLNTNHPVGNAKFLENAVKAYAFENFPRTVLHYTYDKITQDWG